MKNIFFSAAIALAAIGSSNSASAQVYYNFSKSTQTYTSLSGATSVSKQSLWTSDTSFTVPIGFSVKIGNATVNNFQFAGGTFVLPQQAAVQSGFLMLSSALMDRGANQGVAKSDIRYTTTGTAGSRIFKLEIYNAGFEDEFFNNGELKDSISMQLWLYEGSNITEFRYGPSMISNFNDYFGFKMICGYLKDMDTATTAFDKFYVVDGTPEKLDSMSGTFSNKGLNSVPSAGTVFRFAPKGSSTTGVHQLTRGTLAKVFPTLCSSELNIDNPGSTLQYAMVAMNGQVVREGTFGKGKTSLDMTPIVPGVYILRLTDEGKNIDLQQVVKQ